MQKQSASVWPSYSLATVLFYRVTHCALFMVLPVGDQTTETLSTNTT